MSEDPEETLEQLMVRELISLAVSDKGYSSESSLARAMGIGPHKLSRWKNGKHPVSPEGRTLISILIKAGSAESIVKLLDQSGRDRMLEHLENLSGGLRGFIDLVDDPKVRKKYEEALASMEAAKNSLKIARDTDSDPE